MGFDLYFRKAREKAWDKVSKASDERTNVITEAFKNVKTLKLYNWTQVFTDKIKSKRNKQDELVWKAESNELQCRAVHSVMDSLL
jgi:ABC-type bacteriocin/lantibiotic exporter with double-glycine peptidase domain